MERKTSWVIAVMCFSLVILALLALTIYEYTAIRLPRLDIVFNIITSLFMAIVVFGVFISFKRWLIRGLGIILMALVLFLFSVLVITPRDSVTIIQTDNGLLSNLKLIKPLSDRDLAYISSFYPITTCFIESRGQKLYWDVVAKVIPVNNPDQLLLLSNKYRNDADTWQKDVRDKLTEITQQYINGEIKKMVFPPYELRFTPSADQYDKRYPGIVFCQELKRRDPSLPVICMAMTKNDSIDRQLRDAGCIVIYKASVDIEAILAIIKKALA